MNYQQHIRPDLIETWEEDDWDDEGWEEEDPETACMNCGKPTSCEGCQCCGGALCYYCSEVSAGFCDACLADPGFSERMAELTREP